MNAILRLRAVSYGPETIQAKLKALDGAWDVVQFHFYDSPDTYEAARLRLANAILRAAGDGNRNVGLAAMEVHYQLEPRDCGLEAIMSQRVNNPRYWRNYAEETRTIAEQIKAPECKRMLIGWRRPTPSLRVARSPWKPAGHVRTPTSSPSAFSLNRPRARSRHGDGRVTLRNVAAGA